MSLFNLEESEKLHALFYAMWRGDSQATKAYHSLLEELNTQGKIQSIEAFVTSQENDLAAFIHHLQGLQDKAQQLQAQWRELLYTQRTLPEKALLNEVYPFVEIFIEDK